MTIIELQRKVKYYHTLVSCIEEKLDEVELVHLDRVDKIREALENKKAELNRFEQLYRDASGECSFCQNQVTKSDGKYECRNCRE